jgi:PAS domain S-box-containing protein
MDYYGNKCKEEEFKFYEELSAKDTVVKDRFEKILDLAIMFLKVPIAYISFFDEKYEWIKEKKGIKISKIPIEESIYPFLSLNKKMLEIHEINKEKRYQKLKILSAGKVKIEFYACLLIISDYGAIVGALHVLDAKREKLSKEQIYFLEILNQRICTIFQEKKKENQILEYQKLYNFSADLIGLANLDGTIHRANPAFIRELGANPELIEDKNFYSFIHPSDLKKAKEKLANLEINPNPIQSTIRMISRSGEIKAIEWMCTMEKGTKNFFAVGRNITEIEKKSHQLLESEKKFRTLYENAQTFMCIHDLEGNIISVNKSGSQYLDYKMGDFSKKTLYELIPKERHNYLNDYLDKMGKVGRVKGIVKMMAKSGEPKTFTFDNVLVKSELGKPYVIGNAVDWTDLLFLKEDLVRTKEMLEETTKMTKIGGWELNFDRKEMIWSKEMKRIFEMPLDQNPKYDWESSRFLDQKAVNELRIYYHNAITNKISFEHTLQFKTISGKVLWGKMSGVPLFSKNGKCTKIIGAFQDITKERNNADALRKAKVAAEDANKAKSEFLANMSHEIRTPLNGIIGFTDLLSRSNLDSTQKEYMDLVHKSGQILLGIVNDILDFSKIEARKVTLNIEKSDLFDIVYQTINIISFQSTAKNLKVVSYLDPALKKYAWVDEFRLKQVLINLLGNAVKFTKEGEIGLKVSVLQKMNNNIEKIRFEVTDTGLGIDSKKLEQIFDAFMQSDNNTTKKFGGTGLGLSISSQIVKLFGSELKVKSIEGKGSEFHFDLVVKTEAAASIEDFYHSGSSKILVIESIATNFVFIENLLRGENITIFHSRTGMKALQKLYDGEQFDIILINSEMPLIPGKEIYRIIKQNQTINGQNELIALLYATQKDIIEFQNLNELRLHQDMINPLKVGDIRDAIVRLKKEVKMETKPDLEGFNKTPNRKILITEDNEVNMILVKSFVKNLFPATQIIEAVNGQMAVEKASEYKPDMILMDIQLPIMDGIEATKIIREQLKDKWIPIIAVTAGNVKGERERCIASGMDDFVTKPITEDILSKILYKWAEEVNRDSNTEISHVDFDVINTASQNDINFKKELIKLSNVSLNESLADFKLCFSLKDIKGLKAAGHKLKGTASAMGFKELGGIALCFESIEKFNEAYINQLIELTSKEIDIINTLLSKKMNAIY